MILWMMFLGGLLQMISQRYYSILYMQQTVTYTRLYTVSSVSYWHYSVSSTTSKIFKWKETREILFKVTYGW